MAAHAALDGVGSINPPLNFVRDGIILADLHKSLQIWGWFLPKKIDLPPKGGGVEVGILGGQKIKTPGNVMNCPENL